MSSTLALMPPAGAKVYTASMSQKSARVGVGTPSTRTWGKATLAPLSSPSTLVVAEAMPSGAKTRWATRCSHLRPVIVSCSAATASQRLLTYANSDRKLETGFRWRNPLTKSCRVNPIVTALSPAYGAMPLCWAMRSQIMNSRVTHGSYI